MELSGKTKSGYCRNAQTMVIKGDFINECG
jgi:hypothetical protein